MTVIVDKEWVVYTSKHLDIQSNFPKKCGTFPPWFSCGIHLDFHKGHIVIFFWKYIITFGKTITWGGYDLFSKIHKGEEKI